MTLKHAAPRVNSALIACVMTCALTLPPSMSAHAQNQSAQPSPAQMLPPGHPAVQQPSPQSVAAEGVRTSANIARGAADICHIDAAKIARFKAVARKNFTDAPDFDGEWNLGYKEAQSTVDRFAALKTSNPQEYARKIGEACPALSRGIDESTAGQ
ncbi:hypothetical protein [Caballeronia sp. DA-9]|uniref:hypothetical protein n=1 Tax=Caballeronia sp. DA-9 TaxID=3436237 RepID=UPI003F67FF1A